MYILFQKTSSESRNRKTQLNIIQMTSPLGLFQCPITSHEYITVIYIIKLPLTGIYICVIWQSLSLRRLFRIQHRHGNTRRESMGERHHRRRVAEVTITFYMKYSCHAMNNNMDKVPIHYFINQYISLTLLYRYFCTQANGEANQYHPFPNGFQQLLLNNGVT